MKKAFLSIIIITAFIILTATTAFAGELSHSAPQSVSIGGDGFADIEITVSGGGEMFAGAQFELILGDGVTIEKVSFNKGGNSNIIPPTEARGSYFFSLFAGKNEFAGDFTCTVTISYEGTEPSQIIVAEIQRYVIKSPGDVATTIDSTQSIIEIQPARTIGGMNIPIGSIAQNWIWIVVIALAAGVIILILLRKRMEKKAGKEKITIDKAEYERLLARQDEAGQQKTGPDTSSDDQ